MALNTKKIPNRPWTQSLNASLFAFFSILVLLPACSPEFRTNKSDIKNIDGAEATKSIPEELLSEVETTETEPSSNENSFLDGVDSRDWKPIHFSSCPKRLSGSWDFGLNPFGCAMPKRATLIAQNIYPDYALHPLAQDKAAERKRYVRLMNDFIVHTAEEYLKRRDPQATEQAIEAWSTLALTVAHQESYWTHYRIGSDRVFRLMRGDFNHGFGMMQIDGRWHKKFIASQEVFDLKSNLVFALDLLYFKRGLILKAPCKSEKNWDNYNRSIYSAYNGGVGSKCRWQNKAHKWYRNDRGFLFKYINKVWEKDLDLAAVKLNSMGVSYET